MLDGELDMSDAFAAGWLGSESGLDDVRLMLDGRGCFSNLALVAADIEI